MTRALGTITLVCLLVPAARAEVVQEKYPNGKPRRKYAVDADGRKHGAYTEFDPTGKVTVRATYKAGRLDGKYVQYFKGLPVLTLTFKDGKPVYARGREEIAKTLADITAAPDKEPDDPLTADREAALRRLKAYRYLANVPYKDLTLDERMNRGAQAAAEICAKLKRLDHDPPNPGLPEDEYKLARTGARSSNLGAGYRDLPHAVDGWMDDSDEGNISRLGHRRWCINPQMRKVGFGKAGRFVAMWSFDRSRTRVPPFDFISFPAAGLTPVEYFRPRWAWNVILNPTRYRPPTKAATPAIFELDKSFNKVGEPLELDHQGVDTVPFGIPNSIMFRPKRDVAAAGKRYLVEITGLRRKDGRPAVLRYVVEFMSVK